MFDDMVEAKDLALVRSDFTPQMNKEEGEIMTKMILQAYHDDEAYHTYIKPFTQSPEKFNFDAFMAYFRGVHDVITADAAAAGEATELSAGEGK